MTITILRLSQADLDTLAHPLAASLQLLSNNPNTCALLVLTASLATIFSFLSRPFYYPKGSADPFSYRAPSPTSSSQHNTTARRHSHDMSSPATPAKKPFAGGAKKTPLKKKAPAAPAAAETPAKAPPAPSAESVKDEATKKAPAAPSTPAKAPAAAPKPDDAASKAKSAAATPQKTAQKAAEKPAEGASSPPPSAAKPFARKASTPASAPGTPAPSRRTGPPTAGA